VVLLVSAAIINTNNSGADHVADPILLVVVSVMLLISLDVLLVMLILIIIMLVMLIFC
jgi:hypothetical protein